MSAHESMEQADHAKEASEENRKIALLIAQELLLQASEIITPTLQGRLLLNAVISALLNGPPIAPWPRPSSPSLRSNRKGRWP